MLRLRTIITLIVAAFAFAVGAPAAMAQVPEPDENGMVEIGGEQVKVPSGRQKVFRSKYRTVEQGDSVWMLVFNEITVYPPLLFKNKKEQEFYWRTVRDVKKTLPYAKLICATLLETYEYIETFPTQAEREKYLKQMESSVFQQYKPLLKRFSRSQARLLVKLIQRETDQTSYDIVKAFLGSFRAVFWQGFGSLFGVSLKGKYEPARNSNDAMIERICVAVEQGML